jgi:hypothetical protein
MKYLKKFENNAAYEAAESGLILPNVSFVTENNTVHYNPYVDPYGGHEYVEIGGLKWATMNIGANSITDYGQYFQWGDTQGYYAEEIGYKDGKKTLSWITYKYGDGTNNPSEYSMKKYNRSDHKTVLEVEDDAAAANWGGNWRMPTTEEFQSLSAVTTTAWTADYEGSGVAGIILTSNTDQNKKLFIPASGYVDNSTPPSVGTTGSLWSSSLYDAKNGYLLVGFSSRVNWNPYAYRFSGRTIRPVAN